MLKGSEGTDGVIELIQLLLRSKASADGLAQEVVDE